MLTVSQLNFIPLESSGGQAQIIATINASSEALYISAAKLNITGLTTFSSGDTLTEAINGGTTTISGGKITASSVEADRMDVTTLSSIISNLGTITAGAITGVTLAIGSANNIFKVDADGNTWWGHANFASAIASMSKAGAAKLTSLVAIGTLTSRSGTSERVVISSDDIRFYNDDNVNSGRISGGLTGTAAMHFKVGTNIKLLLEAAQLQLRFGTDLWIQNAANTKYISISQNTTVGGVIGNSSGGGYLHLYGNGGTTDVKLDNGLNCFKPDDNELCYLGNNANEWKAVHALDTSINHADIAEKLKVAPQYKFSPTELKLEAKKNAEELDVIRGIREKDFSNLHFLDEKSKVGKTRKPTKEEQEAEREKQITNVIKMEADFMEEKESLSKIPYGSVVVITNEGIIPSDRGDDIRYAGIISEKPGVKIGSKKKGPYVAFGGVVPCRVVGTCKAGDMLTTAINGCAQYSADPQVGALVGKALEDKSTPGEGLIDIWVK